MRILAPSAPHRQPPKSILRCSLTFCTGARSSGQARSSLERSPLLSFFFRGSSSRPLGSVHGQDRAASGSASPPGCAPACPSLPLLPAAQFGDTKTSSQRNVAGSRDKWCPQGTPLWHHWHHSPRSPTCAHNWDGLAASMGTFLSTPLFLKAQRHKEATCQLFRACHQVI